MERRARAICSPRAQETRPGPEMKDVTGVARRGEATVRTHVPNEILTTRAVQIYLCRGAKPEHSVVGLKEGFEIIDQTKANF